MPIGRKATYIKTETPRVACKDYKTIRQADIGFADIRLTSIRVFGRYVLALVRFMTITDAKKYLRLICNLIETMQRKAYPSFQA